MGDPLLLTNAVLCVLKISMLRDGERQRGDDDDEDDWYPPIEAKDTL